MPDATPTGAGGPRYEAVSAGDGGYVIVESSDGKIVASVFGLDDKLLRAPLARRFAAGPDYYAACEWIEKRLLETGEDLADVRDVAISSLMLGQLMEVHRGAKGGAS